MGTGKVAGSGHVHWAIEMFLQGTGLVCGGQKTPLDIHYAIFDEKTLKDVFKAAGLVNVEHWDWRTTEHSHVDDYSQAYGLMVSLNMQASKPRDA